MLGETLTPDGTMLRLTRRDSEYIILANGKSLMSSRMHGSEEALATFACERARKREQSCVLVGGLGMGFTLRATLDVLPPDATVVVAELVPAVVEWVAMAPILLTVPLTLVENDVVASTSLTSMKVVGSFW